MWRCPAKDDLVWQAHSAVQRLERSFGGRWAKRLAGGNAMMPVTSLKKSDLWAPAGEVPASNCTRFNQPLLVQPTAGKYCWLGVHTQVTVQQAAPQY